MIKQFNNLKVAGILQDRDELRYIGPTISPVEGIALSFGKLLEKTTYKL